MLLAAGEAPDGFAVDQTLNCAPAPRRKASAHYVLHALEADDVLTEREDGTDDDSERFDSELALMAGELARLLSSLEAALGGVGPWLRREPSTVPRSARRPFCDRSK